jgi:hypothetical protein
MITLPPPPPPRMRRPPHTGWLDLYITTHMMMPDIHILTRSVLLYGSAPILFLQEQIKDIIIIIPTHIV